MTETRYQLIFSGRLQPDTLVEQVRQAVKERFRLNDAQLQRLFSGDPVTVKRDLDLASAERYQRAFVAAGAVIELAPMAASTPSAPSPEATTLVREARPAELPSAPAMDSLSPPTSIEQPSIEQPSTAYAEGASQSAQAIQPTPSIATPTSSEDEGAKADADADAAIEVDAGAEAIESMRILPAGTLIGEQAPTPEIVPDTSHLQLAPPEATSLEDCAPPPPAPPQLDLSRLALAPVAAAPTDQAPAGQAPADPTQQPQ